MNSARLVLVFAFAACASVNGDVRALIDAGRFDDALSTLNSRLARDADDFRSLCLRAEVEVKLVLYDEAVADLERAIAVEPQEGEDGLRAWLRYELGYLSFNFVGTVERGLRNFDAAIAIDPRHYKALEHRAHACAALGRHEQAVRDYQRAIECWPRGEDSDDLLLCFRRGAASLRVLGRLAEAAELDGRADAWAGAGP